MAAPIKTCEMCGRPVRMMRKKNYAGRAVTVKCSPKPTDILLDKDGQFEYYYNGNVVRGREVADGLRAYRLHVCNRR